MWVLTVNVENYADANDLLELLDAYTAEKNMNVVMFLEGMEEDEEQT